MNKKELTNEEVKNIFKEKTGRKVESVGLVQVSDDNLLYKVFSGSDNFAVRFGKRGNKEDVGFETVLLKHLESKNVPASIVVLTNQSEDVWEYEGYVSVIFEWIDGIHVNLDVGISPSLEQLYSAGRALAYLHNANLSFDAPVYRKRTIYTEFERFLSEKDFVTQFFSNGFEIMKWAEELIEFAQDNNEKQIVIHNDFRHHNVFYDSGNNNEVKAIIDFDWACTGPAIKDLALALVEWSFPDGDNKHNDDALKALLKGYSDNISSGLQLNTKDLSKWMQFACLSDAATHWCDSIIPFAKKDNSVEERLKSYMLGKAKYFRDNSIDYD